METESFNIGLSEKGLSLVRDNPDLLSLLYDINALPEVVASTRNPLDKQFLRTAVVAFALGKGLGEEAREMLC